MTIDRNIIEQILKTRPDGTLYHRESQTLEYKESFNFAGLAEYFRDFAAFANNKGGYLIFGIKDKPRRELIGLNNNAKNQLEKLDPEKISGFILEDFTGNIVWDFDIVEINSLYYGVFYIHEADVKPIICKKDEMNIIKNGEIYFRYGGRTQKIQYAELEAIINHRIEKQNACWMDLITKIGKSGPQNAAVLDLERGTIEKNNSQVLVVDESLIESINWIKEGCFNEKDGAPTLKLVGQVQPIDTLEIVKREKINRLKEYPLSAKELADSIKERCNIQQHDIWRIIRENDIKTNTDYSIYNFRNKKQEEDYEQTGKVPSGTPSIYKPSTIDYIIQIYNNEH
jgi:hypothetical protein